MHFTDFADLFLKTKEKELEEKVWEFWLVKYPTMTEEDFISYEEMLSNAKGQVRDDKKEILADGYYIDQVFF